MTEPAPPPARRAGEPAAPSQAEPTPAVVLTGAPAGGPPAAGPLSAPAAAAGSCEDLLGTPPAASVRRRSAVVEPGFRAIQLVWLLLTVAEGLVALRILFTAAAANRAAGFVRFVDGVAGALVAPFHPVVADARLGNGGLLEVGSLIAMAVFLAAALIVVRLVRILTAPRLPGGI